MPSIPRIRAVCVHLFTAIGAILAMLSIEAAAQHQWAIMMLWLVVAFVIDGIDGPLARKFDVKEHASEWDGVLLDLIIDFLTYVFIPAFALWQSDLLPKFWGGVAAGVICFASVIYFADTRMKTVDKSFAGFPGCWNMVVIVFFALQPNPTIIIITTALLTIAMFLPLKFVHPVRTKQFRLITLPIALLWVLAAGVSAWHGFAASAQVNLLLYVTSIYLLVIGIVQQVFYSGIKYFKRRLL